MEPATLTEFPNFHDDDFTRNSKYFAQKLRDPGPKLIKQAREEGAAAYHLEFKRNLKNKGQPGFWIRKDVNERSRFETSSALLLEISNGKLMDPEHRRWEWLLGTLYNKQPDFDNETLASLLSGCMGLIGVAKSIGSADHVHRIVDLAFLQQDESLWSSSFMNPGAWAELACRTHSLVIFIESVCHVLGKWLMISEDKKADIMGHLLTYRTADFSKRTGYKIAP